MDTGKLFLTLSYKQIEKGLLWIVFAFQEGFVFVGCGAADVSVIAGQSVSR